MSFELPRKQLSPSQIRSCNASVVAMLSDYLNFTPDAITPESLREITSLGVGEEYAFAELLAAYCGLDTGAIDRDLYRNYFPQMVHLLDETVFMSDPYYRLLLSIPGNTANGNWQLKRMTLKPCEAFVCNDFLVTEDRRMIPQIGFFKNAYAYPAILENGREWMTLLPNETVTTLPAVEASYGRVLTYGLGLGYFAYTAARKESVCSVSVVEKSENAIALFESVIRPLFPADTAEKIKIIRDDAFHYAENEMPKHGYDFVFADIWRDVGDGRELYLKMKNYEGSCPGTSFRYWLEDTIACYLDDGLWPEKRM